MQDRRTVCAVRGNSALRFAASFQDAAMLQLLAQTMSPFAEQQAGFYKLRIPEDRELQTAWRSSQQAETNDTTYLIGGHSPATSTGV
jgi:hypothetical protein